MGSGGPGFSDDTTQPAVEDPTPARGPATVTSSRRERAGGPVPRFGRYVVLRPLGAGGMGEVMLAYDPQLDRRVALKRVRHEASDARQRARLLAEARAMAQLQHPNVAVVHDVGEWNDEVFLAMEYIEGLTLRGWLAAAPRDWREIVDVFVKAGEGLRAAHAANLVHRDFKPDNVMIGDDGSLRVLDFGLATALAVERTDAGGTVDAVTTPDTSGTPAYMSPEQFRGQRPDHRSDQFSYCVALYEALYGQRPFVADILPLLMEAVLEREPQPPPPSSAPAWLFGVIGRGLAKEPDGRFPDMEALLAELRRDRHRARRRVLGGLAVAGVAAAAWLGGARAARQPSPCDDAGVVVDEVWDRAGRARAEAAFTRSQLDYATEAWHRVDAGLEVYAADLRASYGSACEAAHAGTQSPQLVDRRAACLDRRTQRLRSLVRILGEATPTTVERSLGAAEGLPRVEVCEDADRMLAGAEPPTDPAVAERVTTLRAGLAEVQTRVDTGIAATADDSSARLLAEAESLDYPPIHAEALLARARVLDGLQPKDAGPLLERAYRVALQADDDPLAAEVLTALLYNKSYRQKVELRDTGWMATSTGWAQRGTLEPRYRAGLWRGLAIAHAQFGRLDQASTLLEQALTTMIEAYGPDHPRLATVLGDLGSQRRKVGKLDAARQAYARAIAIVEQARPATHPTLGYLLLNLGNVDLDEQRFGAARGRFERALAIFRGSRPVGHADIQGVIRRLAEAEIRLGLVDEGLARSTAQLAETEAREGPNSEAAIRAQLDHGALLFEHRRDAEALAAFESALDVLRAERGPDHPTTENAEINRALALLRLERLPEASAALEGLRERLGTKYGEDHPTVVFVLNMLVEARLAQHAYPDAVAVAKVALAQATTRYGEDHVQVAQAAFRLGKAYRGAEDVAAARSAIDRALDIRVRSYGPDASNLAGPLLELGLLDEAAGDPIRAQTHLERAAALDGVDDADLAQIERALAQVRWSQGHHDDARAIARRAAARDPSSAGAKRWLADHPWAR